MKKVEIPPGLETENMYVSGECLYVELKEPKQGELSLSYDACPVSVDNLLAFLNVTQYTGESEGKHYRRTDGILRRIVKGLPTPNCEWDWNAEEGGNQLELACETLPYETFNSLLKRLDTENRKASTPWVRRYPYMGDVEDALR